MKRENKKTTSALIANAIAELPYDDEASFLRFNAAVVALQERGSWDVLEAGCSLCDSPDPQQRMVGTAILGELGQPDRSFPDACCDRLIRLMREDPVQDVVESAIYALGHLGNRRADPEVLRFGGHELPAIRRAVAFALVGANDPESVETLLQLMCDSHEETRDWATTAIGGSVEIDGERIRQALLDRVSDWDAGTRTEAHFGLARRGDRRALANLVAELERVERNEERTDWDYNFAEIAKIVLGIGQDEEIDAKHLLAALRRKFVRA